MIRVSKFEDWYLDTTTHILDTGRQIGDRTGTGTLSVFNVNYTHDLVKEPFPILSCRKFDVIKPITEMIGFMNAITNSEWYNERGCPFWNGFGLPADINKSVRRPDHELASDYCSHKGKYKPSDPEYLSRMRMLNSVGYEAGLKLLDEENINFYKDVLVGKKGDLGPIYGHMWRYWPKAKGGTFDQLRYAFDELKERPHNRRILINGWNPEFLPDFYLQPHENVPNGNMSLTPCHVLHEYHTAPMTVAERVNEMCRNGTAAQLARWEALTNVYHTDEQFHNCLDDMYIPSYFLDISWFQRSWDFMLGAPANIAGYAAMLIMMAKLQGMVPRYVNVNAVNVHIYNNHIKGAKEILSRRDNGVIPSCKPVLQTERRDKVTFIDQFEPRDFEIEDYKHLDHVKFPISF